MEEQIDAHSSKTEDSSEFKKPVLIGRVGKLPKKATNAIEKVIDEKKEENVEKVSNSKPSSSLPPAVLLKELSTPIPYKEPKWSGLCPEGTNYALEVVKSGVIVETVDLTKKSHYVFGRLANCDVVMAHPTISRHHCVLQYKAFATEGEPPSGWYLFELGSTHGTYLNRERVKSNHYVRVRVGHQLKFGNSTRTYIVVGPEFDAEGESELTVTEIKQKALEMKLDRDRMIQEAIEQREKDRLEAEKKREEQGIDWGMGEDAEEEPDLFDNPFAATANEELYLQDPKKTLRGYFERSGLELAYDCEERGVGQYLCRVELPIDDARGNPVMAEVLHKGKKKEAVIACALEACRMLDRAGLLRQAKHESRRKKKRDWSENDYYDSDEDTFLDRTGGVERKRQQRMKGAKEEKPVTYDDLLKQISDLESQIGSEQKSLERLRAASSAARAGADADADTDALDAFMTSLGKQSMADKAEISKTKMRIHKLNADLTKTRRLAELARPPHLPPILTAADAAATTATTAAAPATTAATPAAVYGKRIKLKPLIQKPTPKAATQKEDSEFVEELDSDEEEERRKQKVKEESQSELKTEVKIDLVDNGHDVEVKEENKVEEKTEKRIFGPMRPPENYTVPESYFEQQSDRDIGVMEDD